VGCDIASLRRRMTGPEHGKNAGGSKTFASLLFGLFPSERPIAKHGVKHRYLLAGVTSYMKRMSAAYRYARAGSLSVPLLREGVAGGGGGRHGSFSSGRKRGWTAERGAVRWRPSVSLCAWAAAHSLD